MKAEYNDAYSRALFMAFKEAIEPLMTQVAPDWLLHHMTLERGRTHDFREEVTIRLVIRPIGDANFSDRDADLSTGPKRIVS
jgi:hypothetical protein